MKEMVQEYMRSKGQKDSMTRVRIKEGQMLNVYEKKRQEEKEEKDPNFSKIITHIDRVLKITTS